MENYITKSLTAIEKRLNKFFLANLNNSDKTVENRYAALKDFYQNKIGVPFNDTKFKTIDDKILGLKSRIASFTNLPIDVTYAEKSLTATEKRINRFFSIANLQGYGKTSQERYEALKSFVEKKIGTPFNDTKFKTIDDKILGLKSLIASFTELPIDVTYAEKSLTATEKATEKFFKIVDFKQTNISLEARYKNLNDFVQKKIGVPFNDKELGSLDNKILSLKKMVSGFLSQPIDVTEAEKACSKTRGLLESIDGKEIAFSGTLEERYNRLKAIFPVIHGQEFDDSGYTTIEQKVFALEEEVKSIMVGNESGYKIEKSAEKYASLSPNLNFNNQKLLSKTESGYTSLSNNANDAIFKNVSLTSK